MGKLIQSRGICCSRANIYSENPQIIMFQFCYLQRMVIKTKSVEFMPFSLSFFLFLNGGVWSAYAALVKDYFIGVSFLDPFPINDLGSSILAFL